MPVLSAYHSKKPMFCVSEPQQEKNARLNKVVEIRAIRVPCL